MDEQVLKAMARWPNVPAVHGWLRLDRRGGWHLIDRGQAGFDEARDGRGSPITSPPIVEFIHRNYAHDELGRWYWQNGPQRVYADLDAAPLVFRVFGEGRDARLVAHTGEPVSRVNAGWIGPAGEILLAGRRIDNLPDEMAFPTDRLVCEKLRRCLQNGGSNAPSDPCPEGEWLDPED